jgi:hypothetical protein
MAGMASRPSHGFLQFDGVATAAPSGILRSRNVDGHVHVLRIHSS